jgi:agmatinase
MIKDPAIWAGLNQPNMRLEDADLAVFGIPFDGGVSFRAGAKDAPSALRSITYTITPTTEHFERYPDLRVKDLGDFGEGGGLEERPVIFEAVRRQVAELVRLGKPFTMIGGDHSTTIPVLQGIDDALSEPFGILHLDAHFDLCADIGGDSLSHGSTERRALELANVGSTDRLFFLGIRSAEMDELDFMAEHKVNVASAARIAELGVPKVLEEVKAAFAGLKHVYMTLDIDCLDPGFAGGTGTPQFGGLSPREVLTLLRGLFELPIIGFDVVEIAPKLDPAWTSVFAGRKLITECWGHWWRQGLGRR